MEVDLIWVGPVRLGDDPAALLSAFQSAQVRIMAEEAIQIEAAARFAALHVDAATGEIDEFATVEFGAVTGKGTEGGRVFLLESLELTTRLPRVWERIRSGEVAGWRGLRIADKTHPLSDDAVAWADRQLAPRAGKVGPTKLQQIVEEAVTRADPEAALAHLEAAREDRRADFYPDGPVTYLNAVLDTADAADLEAAVAAIATALDGEEPLDVRRSRALGMLARGEVPGDADVPAEVPRVVEPRQVVLHVHLTETESIAQVRSRTGRVLGVSGLTSLDQVRDWVRDAGTVVVKPVIDPAETLTSAGYQPSRRVRDHVTEVCGTCAFPWCNRPADGLDLDHIVPYDPGGPPGQTTTENLAALCRRHHRTKTFTGWSYQQIAPGEFLWTSLYGWRFLRDAEGTTPLGRGPASTLAA